MLPSSFKRQKRQNNNGGVGGGVDTEDGWHGAGLSRDLPPPPVNRGELSLGAALTLSLPCTPAAQPLLSRPTQRLAIGSQAPTGQGAAPGDGGPGPAGTPRCWGPGRAGQVATCTALHQLCH